MATVFKTFLNNDVATTRTLLNEAIPIDGKIMFGSYFEPPISGETSNIKTFPHEMFQSVYDYPYLKSSANHIFDITLGYASDTLLDTDEVTYPDAAQAKKRALYNQFAQVLVGHDKDGNILKFDEDGNILEGGDKYDEAYLLSVARLLNKDEMKKGSFYLQLDFAVTEPGQRLYTDPGSPPAWPVAENPTLSFKDFAAKTGCPAGFFEYNAGSAETVNVVVAGNGSTTNFDNGANFTFAGGVSDPVVYNLVSPGPLGAPAANEVNVLIETNAITTLKNIVAAINDSEGAGTGGTAGSGKYRYGASVGANPDIVSAVSFESGLANGQITISIQSLVPAPSSFNLSINTSGTGSLVGDIENSSTSVPFDDASGATSGPVDFETGSGDTTINSDDYRRISMIITDEGAQNDYRVNSPAGDYGILKIKEYKVEKWDAATNTISDVCVIDAEALQAAADGDTGTALGDLTGYDRKVGLVYYQAGVVAITPYSYANFAADSLSPADGNWEDFTGSALSAKIPDQAWWDASGATPTNAISHTDWTACSDETVYTDRLGNQLPTSTADQTVLLDDGVDSWTVAAAWENEPIDSSAGDLSNATGFRRRMVRMAFNNTTELNSSIYFCRLNNNEFNYSANPTYLNESKIRVKETTLDAPVSYITTVGLYSADNELLAQAKLSEPVRKDPTSEFVLRVRLDY